MIKSSNFSLLNCRILFLCHGMLKKKQYKLFLYTCEFMCQIGLEFLHSSKCLPTLLSLLTIFHIREASSFIQFCKVGFFFLYLFEKNFFSCDPTMFVSSIRHWWEKRRTINYFLLPPQHNCKKNCVFHTTEKKLK